MPEFSKNTDRPVLTAKVINSWNSLKKSFLVQVRYPTLEISVAGLSRREQSSTSQIRFPHHHAVWIQQPFLHPSPSGRLAYHRGFRPHLQQILKLRGPPACKRQLLVVSSSSSLCCVSPHIFYFVHVLVHTPLLSHPARRSGSLQPVSCRGSGCPGISLCSPASPSLLQRQRSERLHATVATGKKKNSSRSLLAFALLLITSGVIGMGAPVPHVLGLLLFTPTRCF